MLVFYRKNNYEDAQKAIDQYNSDPDSGIKDLLRFLRDGTIDLSSIPKAKQTKELVLAYLDMPEVKHARATWISKKLLDDEVWAKLAPKCTDYKDFPPQYLDEKHCMAIAQSEYYATYNLHLIPPEKLTERILLEALVTSFNCLQNPKLDPSIFEKYNIDELKKNALKLRNQRKRAQEKADKKETEENGWIVSRRGYDPEERSFFFIGKQTKHNELEQHFFHSFDEFYSFMVKILPATRRNSDNAHPLAGIDLTNYNFKKTDLSKYDLSGCFIRPEFLEKSHCFVDYSPKILTTLSKQSVITENPNTALVKYDENKPVCLGDVEAKTFRSEEYKYISDIHLTHRIYNNLGSRFTKEQVAYYIKEVAKNLSKGLFTLIAGDTSEHFALNELLYTYMSEYHYGTRVIVLGNHELWDESLYKESAVDDVVDAYRGLLSKTKNSLLLQNELLIQSPSYRYILSEEDINNMDNNAISDLCKDANVIILGGIGFTGYCQDKDPKTGKIYNAEFGLYRKALTTLDEDILQTGRFEVVYNKIRNALSDYRVIVLTHTPKDCWSKEPYMPNWIYVNGHNHRNSLIIDDEVTVLSDNQIGYHNETVQLKSFSIIHNKDLFYEHLDDGIHEISIPEYREFNRSKGIYASLNAITDGTILMLKRDNLYMFLFRRFVKSENKEKLSILDGGAVHSTDFDEQYFFANMSDYVTAVKSVFKKYWETQDLISAEIQKIGGCGTIHGCIIDIDFYNHAYLNPADGKLTFYYATSINHKYVYESLGALLQDQADSCSKEDKARYIEMNKKYQKYLSKKGSEDLQKVSTAPIFVSDTDMYKASRIIKRLYHIASKNVIRAWYDGVLSYYQQNKNSNTLMDFSASFSNTEIEENYSIDDKKP